jgi:hypothetical protein
VQAESNAELHAAAQAPEHAELPAAVHAAPPADAAAVPVPPLRESLHRALESAVVIGAGGALGWGSYSLMRGTFDAVLGADYGLGHFLRVAQKQRASEAKKLRTEARGGAV